MCCRSAPCCFAGTWNSHQSIQNPTLLEWIYLPNFLHLSRTQDQKLMKVGHWGDSALLLSLACVFQSSFVGRASLTDLAAWDTWESHKWKFSLNVMPKISTLERELQLEFQCMVCEYPWHWIISVQQLPKTFEWRINISTSRSKFQAEFVSCPSG